jgi:hypothetical protein
VVWFVVIFVLNTFWQLADVPDPNSRNCKKRDCDSQYDQVEAHKIEERRFAERDRANCTIFNSLLR